MPRDTWIDVTTLGDLLDREAARNHREALVFPDRRVTYDELAAQADLSARGLRALGVGPGDKVGLLIPNRVEYVATLFGAAKIGAVPVPVNLRFKEVELEHVVCNADVRVLVVSNGAREFVDFRGLLETVFPRLPDQDPMDLRIERAPALRQIVMLHDPDSPSGYVSEERFVAGAQGIDSGEIERLQERVRVADVAMILFTSGTTSRPKGAMLTHEGLVRQAHSLARTRYLIGPEDRVWTPLPLFHIGGTMGVLACMAVGCTCCHVGVFDAERALDQIERERCTVALPGFEPLWTPMLEHPRYPSAQLASMRLVQCSGVPERQQIMLRLMRPRMPDIVQICGSAMTESCSYISLARPSDDEETRLTTGGHALPGIEIRVIDPETGEDVPPGEQGEMLLRGHARFAGYYKDPELTAACIDADGWFHSGDVGMIDSRGRYSFIGRLKDMLKVGGENVAAAEIENHLAKHAAVRVVQVVAAPDAYYGEVPCAYVEGVPGASLTEDELIDFCIGRIATFKVPRYVRFVDDWPVSGTKIQKFVLRERIAQELQERGITQAPRIGSRSSGGAPRQPSGPPARA